jgi:DNA replication licensing factor MCM3
MIRDFEAMSGDEKTRVMPVTVRTLESLIRLATAHAKCRLGEKVEERDCQVAENLMKFTLFPDDEESQ